MLIELQRGCSFLEGPRWYRNALYVSDFFTNRVLCWDGEKVETFAEVPGQPSGLGFDSDGNLLVVAMTERRVMRIRGSRCEPFADLSRHTPFPCNDMVVDPMGRAYVGSYGWDLGASEEIRASDLLFVDREGGVRTAAPDLVFPNGMALIADGGTLLVAETFAARISAFDVSPDGSLSNRRIFIAFSDRQFDTITQAISSGATLPDGIALDPRGDLWVGSAVGNAVLRVSSAGMVIGKVEIGDFTPFSVAVGGAKGEWLFICANPPMGFCDPAKDFHAKLLQCNLPSRPATEVKHGSET